VGPLTKHEIMNSRITTNPVSVAFVGMSLLFITPARAMDRQYLTGHVPAAAVRLQPVGRLPGASRLNLAIGLPLRNQQALNNLLDQLYDPASLRHRRYLTAEQFAEQFGPTQRDYEALKVWAESRGLAVTGTHPNRTLLDVSGAVTDIERAFHVTLQVYRHPTESRTFHAPDGEPSVDLSIPILHVSGLDDFSPPRPAAHESDSNGHRGKMALTGSGPGGALLGNDFRAAYLPGVSLSGAGQSVALVQFDGYYTNDITAYEDLAGLPPVALTNVLVGGVNGSPGSANGEVALDIEMALAMAPGLSRVIVYEGNGPADVLNRIATDNAARQISSSWVLSFDPTVDQIFQQYAAQGQSFFEISGDWEAAYPWIADDPFITVVGGTELTTDGPGGVWVSEAVWNLGFFPTGSSIGTGGGISPTYAIPSWQQGLSMIANKGSTTRRNSPDVAMVADNLWAVADNGHGKVVWGTSASAPLWAGFTALANELAELHGQPPVGFINPAIYALGKGPDYNSVFHDITTGNNNSSQSSVGYSAVPGYDLCTGWGTPNGSNLLYALALPQSLQILPGTNLIASGPAGGPFSPSALNYSLTNSSAGALDWRLANAAPWLDASVRSGTLSPGAPATTVTLSLNSVAYSLGSGVYPANVWFTNLNDGAAQSRMFTLAVYTVPVIITEPASQIVPEGATATFTVTVASDGPLFYQWTRHGVVLVDDGRINGSSGSPLTISNVSSADVGAYTVVVSNPLGSVTNSSGILAVIPVTAPGISLATLYSFKDGNDGANPNGLVLATNGYLYGTANVGPNAGGTAFRITTNGTLTTLHTFTGGNDGGMPRAPLIQANDGNLYGTTADGGASYGGTAFKMTPGGALTTLHAFSGGGDGANCLGRLLQGIEGNFYGTTYSGGDYGNGTVFKISSKGSLFTLHGFGSGDGANPPAGLALGSDGNFYGITMNGGVSPPDGTVFRITPAGNLTTIFKFDRTTGWFPNAGLVRARDGSFYGSTINGGAYGHGTVFRISPSGLFTVLHSFDGVGDGEWPDQALLEDKDGYFYGTTSYGGTYGDGTVFRMTPGGVLTTLVQFDGFNGATPSGTLVQSPDGSFYGATLNGGANGDGTVFRLSVPAPSLTIALSGSNLVLSWPSWTADLLLQQTFDLRTNTWMVVTNSPVVTNLENRVVLAPPPGGTAFYRLSK
jgi:uncharacterized repeat protein (TIGR03803 family)